MFIIIVIVVTEPLSRNSYNTILELLSYGFRSE